jgi:polyphosphate kinase
LLVRRDPDGHIRRYAHLGTGNYNPVTARFYTDISLLTSRPEITHAVQAVFNYLTSEADGELETLKPLMVAPLTLAEDVLALIARETAHAKAGRKSGIVAKRIRVRSIVGQYLEHSRIFQFENGGEPEVFCGSADWMARNLYERCEVVYPVKDEKLALRLREEILGSYLKDNVKARVLGPDGIYSRAKVEGERFNAQEYLMGLSAEKG